ncbi:MAG: hypothetical protein AAF960_19415 [Bacteroidota bacterium]
MTKQTTFYLAFAGLLAMLVLYVLTNLGYLGPNPIGRTSRDTEPLIVPAGYAFAIWGPIYLGLIGFPILNFIKRVNRKHELWSKVRTWYALNVVANGIWLAFASYSWQWLTVLVISFMLYSLFRINELLIALKEAGQTVNFWGERLVFSLYFAWVTLATALNVSSALHFYEWAGFGLSEVTWSLIILPAVALVAGAILLKYRDAAFGGVVVWAFLAIAVRHWGTIPSIAYLSVGVAALFLILIFSKGKQLSTVSVV